MYNEAVLSRILIYGVLLVAVSTPSFAQSKTILVFPFENQTADRNIDWLGEGLPELILDRLSSERTLYVFDRAERISAYERAGIPESVSISRSTAIKLGWDLGADAIITGRMVGPPEDFTIEARVVDLARLSVSEGFTATGKLDDVIQMAASLSAVLSRTFRANSAAVAASSIPRSAFENYVRALLTQDPQRRTDLLLEAVRLHPEYAAAMYQLGRAYHVDRNFNASNQAMERIRIGDREYVQAQFLRGLNHYYLGDFAAAVKVFISLTPTYDVLINLGASLASQGDGVGALLAWKRASDEDPLGSDSVFNVGYWNFTKGDMETAVRSFEQFMKLEGRDGEALFLLGRAYDRVGRLEESQRLLALATRLSPRVGQWLTQPLPNLQRLSSEADPTELRLPLDATLWNQQRLARRAGGQDLGRWLEGVRTQLDSQFFGEAVRQLQEISLAFPKAVDVRLLLAEVHEGQGEYELALRAVQQALILEPDNAEGLALREEIGRTLAGQRQRQ